MQVKITFAIALLIGWGTALIALGPRLTRSWVLHQSAATTLGTVVAFDRANHSQITYRYRVSSTEYTGVESGSHADVGRTVTVYYAKRDPSISALSDPVRLFREGVIGMLLICAFLAVGAAVAASRAR